MVKEEAIHLLHHQEQAEGKENRHLEVVNQVLVRKKLKVENHLSAEANQVLEELNLLKMVKKVLDQKNRLTNLEKNHLLKD